MNFNLTKHYLGDKIVKDWMNRACGMHGREEKRWNDFRWGKHGRREQLLGKGFEKL